MATPAPPGTTGLYLVSWNSSNPFVIRFLDGFSFSVSSLVSGELFALQCSALGLLTPKRRARLQPRVARPAPGAGARSELPAAGVQDSAVRLG